MIHSATQCGKFVKFVRWLRKSVGECGIDHSTIAVGILERMWHLTMTSAKRGDIGKVDDETIAESVGWFGEPEDLIDALVNCKWLIRCPEHRLVVNDWSEHAPSHIKKNAHRWGGLLGQSGSSEPVSGDKTAQVSRLVSTPNLTKPNVTQPNLIKRAQFKKPTTKEIKKFATEADLPDYATAYRDYYESNGWKVGRNAMKDWRAAYRNWCKRQRTEFMNGKTTTRNGPGQLFDPNSEAARTERPRIGL